MIGLVLAARLQRGGGGLVLSSGSEAGLPKRPPDGVGLPKRLPDGTVEPKRPPDEAFVPNPPDGAVVPLPNRPPVGAGVPLPKRPPPVGAALAFLPNWKPGPPVGAVLPLPNRPPVGTVLALLPNRPPNEAFVPNPPVGAEVPLPNRPPDEVAGKPDLGAVAAGAGGVLVFVEGAPSESLLDFVVVFVDSSVDSFGGVELSGQLLFQVGSLMSRMACSRVNRLWPGHGLTKV